MNALVVYYSFEGGTGAIAEAIAREINADIIKLKPKREIRTRGFMKYIWGGKQVVMREKPELMTTDFELDEYDFLCIGTPVWSFSFAPPIRTFLHDNFIQKKDIALFCCHEGGPGKTLRNMAGYLRGNSIVGEMDFKNPNRYHEEQSEQKARDWIREVYENL